MLKDRTYKILEILRHKYKAKSYNEVIEKLALKELGIPQDMFGADKGKNQTLYEQR